MSGKAKLLILVSTALGIILVFWQAGFFHSDVAIPIGPTGKDQVPNSPKDRPLDRQQILANLKSQAEEMQKAILEENYETSADLTLPAVIKLAGGRPQWV